MLKSLNCPNCAAPLPVGERQVIALCAYCGSSLKIEADGAQPQPLEQRELTPEALRQINQLLMDGKRAAAIEFYRHQTNLPQAEAATAIKQLAQQLTRRTINRQPVSNVGILLLTAFSAIGVGAVWWGVTHDSWLVMLIGGGWALLQWVVFIPGLQARWFYETGQPTAASVKQLVHLGDVVVRGKPASAVRLWLEVRPAGRTPFQVERNMMMWQYSLEQLAAGTLIEVRCKPERGEAIPTIPLKVFDSGT